MQAELDAATCASLLKHHHHLDHHHRPISTPRLEIIPIINSHHAPARRLHLQLASEPFTFLDETNALTAFIIIITKQQTGHVSQFTTTDRTYEPKPPLAQSRPRREKEQ